MANNDYSFDFVKVCPTVIGRIVTVGHVAFAPSRSHHTKKRCEIKVVGECLKESSSLATEQFYKDYLKGFK